MIGMLIDVTRCTGCGQCVEACAQAHNQPAAVYRPQQAPDGLSDRRYSAIVLTPQEGGTQRFVRKLCRHCLEPACVSVCPVGAMYKTPEGPVLYDPQKCMGCRYCMMACPYGIPRYQWQRPDPLVQKCDFCLERQRQGQPTACAEACPEQVITLGERDELLQIAHQRVQADPARYLPVVYGESDAGGTSVLYISDVSLDFLRLPVQNPVPAEAALPALSTQWLEKVPLLSLATAGLMTGLFYVIGRRMQAEEARLRQASQAGPGQPPEAHS